MEYEFDYSEHGLATLDEEQATVEKQIKNVQDTIEKLGQEILKSTDETWGAETKQYLDSAMCDFLHDTLFPQQELLNEWQSMIESRLYKPDRSYR